MKPAVGEATAENLLAEGPNVVEGARVHEPLFGLLAESADDRRSFLRARPELFDCAGDRRAEAIELLVNIAEPSARMLAAEDWRTLSAEWLYRRLAARLHGGEDMAVSDFLPRSAEGLRDHLCLVKDDEPRWEETARRLVSDEGCISALIRLASLPVALPNAVVAAVRGLDADDWEKFLRKPKQSC